MSPAPADPEVTAHRPVNFTLRTERDVAAGKWRATLAVEFDVPTVAIPGSPPDEDSVEVPIWTGPWRNMPTAPSIGDEGTVIADVIDRLTQQFDRIFHDPH